MTELALSAIYLYPVKSFAGVEVQAWELDAFGLRFDRRWMVVGQDGNFLTQRQYPQMAQVQPQIDAAGRLKLKHPRLGQMLLPPADPKAPRLKVRVWSDLVPAIAVGSEADAWVSEALGVACRLVWFPDDALRQIDTRYAKAGERTAFSDGFPLLLLSQSSLDDLNLRLPQPVSMRRFRPNLVVAGAPAYAEDGWSRIAIAGIALRVVKPCSRCAITTVDPETGEFSGKEPLATLATYRKRGNKVYFGQNLIHEGCGRLYVGAPVVVLSARN